MNSHTLSPNTKYGSYEKIWGLGEVTLWIEARVIIGCKAESEVTNKKICL